jgi:hypothetical protein
MLEKRRFHSSVIRPWGKAFLACLAVCAVSIGLFWLAPDTALAQLNKSQNVVNATAKAAGLGGTTTDLPTIIGRVIYVVLSTVGVIFLALLLFSGYQYMTAGGDAEKIKKAVTRIRNAVIGMLIIAFSFVIVNFILGWLAGETNFWGISGGGGPGSGFGQWDSTGGLGNGQIIEYHYPEPGQTNVARNTAIVITFVNKIDPASFINGWKEGQPMSGDLNSTLVRLHPETNKTQDLLPNQALSMVSPDGRTVMIKPVDPLGNSQKPTWYEVKLENGILNASGTKIFTGSFNTGYTWRFQVSTQIDNSPPHVLSVLPISGGSYARNIVVQVNFDEPMFPMSVAGLFKGSGFQNLQILKSDGGLNETPVDGEFRLSNGYRTVEFVTTDECGMNSCLIKMYCLPADKTIRGLVKAASIQADQSPLAAGYKTGIFDGAVDMAFNSLDGDGDGKATGPVGDPAGGADDYPSINSAFSFYITNEINRDPPYIKAVDPIVKADQVPLDKNVDISWYSDPGDMTGVLLAYTITSKSFRIFAAGPQELKPDTWWFFTKMKNVDDKGEEATSTSKHVQSVATIYHRPFMTSDIPKQNQKPDEVNNYYDPYVRHYVMNIYQNCYNPASYLDKNNVKTQAPADQSNFCNNQAQTGVDLGGSNFYCDFIKTP